MLIPPIRHAKGILGIVGNEFFEEIFEARKYLAIMSPWLTKKYVERTRKLSRDGILVRIITGNDKTNQWSGGKGHRSALEFLKETGNEDENFQFKMLTNLHSKMIIVDDRIAMTGSANFTYMGFFKNVEHISVTRNRDDVIKLATAFKKYWEHWEARN